MTGALRPSGPHRGGFAIIAQIYFQKWPAFVRLNETHAPFCVVVHSIAPRPFGLRFPTRGAHIPQQQCTLQRAFPICTQRRSGDTQQVGITAPPHLTHAHACARAAVNKNISPPPTHTLLACANSILRCSNTRDRRQRQLPIVPFYQIQRRAPLPLCPLSV